METINKETTIDSQMNRQNKRMIKPKTLAVIAILLTMMTVVVVSLGIKFHTPPVETTREQTTQLKGAMLQEFPEFPLYPSAKIVSSQYTPEKQQPFYQPESFQAFLETDQSVSTVIQWYVLNLKKEGWTIKREPDVDSLSDQNIVIEKQNQLATINAERDGDETEIAIFVTKKK